MKFLLDAHLPPQLALAIQELGHDALHTNALSERGRTSDRTITDYAEANSRIVVTKDRDFVHAQIVTGRPQSLLYISTGNIRNRELIALFLACMPELEQAFVSGRLVELGNAGVLLRR